MVSPESATLALPGLLSNGTPADTPTGGDAIVLGSSGHAGTTREPL